MREARCPQCRSVARLVRNPYYGAGLAVHADLLVCDACGYAALADDVPDDELQEQPPPPGRLRRLLRRLLRR
jgi:hypothetical protein